MLFKNNLVKCVKKQNMEENNNLVDIIAFELNYIYNDIYVINYDNETQKLSIMVYFDCRFNEVNFTNLEKINITNDIGKDLYELLIIFCNKHDNFYDLLNNLSNHLNIINKIHNNFTFKKLDNDKNNFEWNPYIYLDTYKMSKFNVQILKNEASSYYLNNKKPKFIDFNIETNFVVEVIIKEILSLGDNDKFEVILNNNNIFDFKIKFLKFKSINDVILSIKLDPYLYPYTPPKLFFDTNLENYLDLNICRLSYFNISNWNVTNTIFNMLNEIYKILEEHATIKQVDRNFIDINTCIKKLLLHNNIEIENNFPNFNIDYIKINNKNLNDNKCWKSGVGYGTDGRSVWNIENYYEKMNTINNNNDLLIDSLYNLITTNNDTTNLIKNLNNEYFIKIISYFVNQINLIELENNSKLYNNIFEILLIINFESFNINSSIYDHLTSVYEEIKIFNSLNKEKHNDNKLDSLFDKIIEFHNRIKKIFEKNKDSSKTFENTYCSDLKDKIFLDCDFDKYYYDGKVKDDITKSCIQKIMREVSSYKNSLPISYESSIFVRVDSENIRKLKALIIGPKDTPYENGCFIFDILIPIDYPNEPPLINLQTTGGGSVRFNPNLYNNGKVCLSLLGTWSGDGGEKWNGKTSTLLQVLISIQSLILVDNPYFNEPGYEKDMNTERGDIENKNYNNKVRYFNIMYAINENIEKPPKEFEDVIKYHFKSKKNDINRIIEIWNNETNIDKDTFDKVKNKCNLLLHDNYFDSI